MKGTTKAMMGATLAMALGLAIVLSLILFLLFDLYCSLFLNRRRKTQPVTAPSITVTTSPQVLPAPGVLQNAPRSFLFPRSGPHVGHIGSSLVNNNNVDLENQIPNEIQENLVYRNYLIPSVHTSNDVDLECESPNESKEHLVYICNPIYDKECVSPSGAHTPYETPESSPSNLGFYDDEEKYSPELMPMKKLQAKASSVSLRDASSLATSASESDTNSIETGSPRTSPSW